MNDNDMETIRKALMEHGDNFWVDDDGNNIMLIDDITEALAEYDLDLKVVVRHYNKPADTTIARDVMIELIDELLDGQPVFSRAVEHLCQINKMG